jgi:hypothetical protein
LVSSDVDGVDAGEGSPDIRELSSEHVVLEVEPDEEREGAHRGWDSTMERVGIQVESDEARESADRVGDGADDALVGKHDALDPVISCASDTEQRLLAWGGPQARVLSPEAQGVEVAGLVQVAQEPYVSCWAVCDGLALGSAPPTVWLRATHALFGDKAAAFAQPVAARCATWGRELGAREAGVCDGADADGRREVFLSAEEAVVLEIGRTQCDQLFERGRNRPGEEVGVETETLEFDHSTENVWEIAGKLIAEESEGDKVDQLDPVSRDLAIEKIGVEENCLDSSGEERKVSRESATREIEVDEGKGTEIGNRTSQSSAR